MQVFACCVWVCGIVEWVAAFNRFYKQVEGAVSWSDLHQCDLFW